MLMLARAHRLGHARGRAQARPARVDELLQPRLLDGRLALLQALDVRRVQVDPDHLVPLAREHRRQRRAELAQSYDGDAHGRLGRSCPDEQVPAEALFQRAEHLDRHRLEPGLQLVFVAHVFLDHVREDVMPGACRGSRSRPAARAPPPACRCSRSGSRIAPRADRGRHRSSRPSRSSRRRSSGGIRNRGVMYRRMLSIARSGRGV